MDAPHDVLGVDPDADEETVRRAYRERVKEAHPDHGGTLAEFRLVRAAYEQLTAGDGEHPGGGGSDDDHRDAPDREQAWTGSTPRDRRGSGGDARRDEPAPPVESRVEYLDYEVLDDYGWALDDPGLFEKAAAAGLSPEDHGRFLVQAGETLLEAAERRGFVWPYSCRGGACANCAVAVREGTLEMRHDSVLTEGLLDRGIRLSCIGEPTTPEMKVVFNVKHLPDVEELLLPPGPFRRANPDG